MGPGNRDDEDVTSRHVVDIDIDLRATGTHGPNSMTNRPDEPIRFDQAFYAIISMQRNNGADRTRVPDHSGDDPPFTHRGVYIMYIFPVLLVMGMVAWVALPVVLILGLR
jgi:hypothetical protein